MRASTSGRRRAMRAIALCLMLGIVSSARAQDSGSLAAQRDATRAEAERLAQEITLSADRVSRIQAEVATLRKDGETITAALILSAKTGRKLSEDVAEIEGRLGVLAGQQAQVKTSLAARRDVLAEVLGALQRMGLNPPPAILVRPEDALGSVRSAILLGAVVPELREETEILIADLAELDRLQASIVAERDRLGAALQNEAAERQRLTLLMEAKKKLAERSLSDMEAERRRADELAAKADTLQSLVASLDRDIAAARREEDALLTKPLPERNQLAPATPFEAMKSLVSLPVSGRITKHFGEADKVGGHAAGDTVQTQSRAIVTAPVDASVLYAGRFRSYGQLLILDAGGGYHIVLAGIGQISVSSGQAVLAGEPVGVMGESRLASVIALGTEKAQPELYVEFRKGGKPVDPAPWWSARSSGRNANDS